MRISAIILAGGLATRMNGVDKGLLLFHKKPLVQHVINRLTPQVDEIIINSNRSAESIDTIETIVTITEKMIVSILDDQQKKEFLKLCEARDKS